MNENKKQILITFHRFTYVNWLPSFQDIIARNLEKGMKDVPRENGKPLKDELSHF